SARSNCTASASAKRRGLPWLMRAPPPAPRRISTMPSASRVRSASRATMRETPWRAARSFSVPRNSPGRCRRSNRPSRTWVPIRDGRSETAGFSLEKNGFQLVAHPTAVRDFLDAAELKSVYYPEVEQLIARVSGAARVVAFDHTLRSGSEAEREEKLLREPVL